MIGNEEKVRWGDDGAGSRPRLGTITSKRTGKGGELVRGLDRRGATRQFAVRDRHRTVTLTATVTEDVTDDDIPEVGDAFRAPVGGRELEFVCTDSHLETFKEDASVLTVSGRTLGHTPDGAPFDRQQTNRKGQK